MIGDQTVDTEGVTPPAPPPEPPTPAPEPPPQPAPAADPDQQFYADYFAQRQGARKALLASSLAGAVREDPNKQAKVVALADKLGLSADTVSKNYDVLSQRVALNDADYNRLLLHHPELASWLSDPNNAALSHDSIPQLTELDKQFRILANPNADITGLLPNGYRFQPDGSIRGPIPIDRKGEQAGEPIIYKNLDALRAKFAREVSQQDNDRFLAEAAADVLRQAHPWFPNFWAAGEASAASTVAAVGTLFGDDLTGQRPEGVVNGLSPNDYRAGAQALLAGSETIDPGVVGGTGRMVGQLLGDAPLYLLGGEVAAPVKALGEGLGIIKATAEGIPTIAQSPYLADVLQTAAAYSPLGARSGINTGADNGLTYGALDALINTLGPAGFGSRVGLANALIPGQETAAGSWMGVAGRLMKHVSSQGGIMAVTELANALHERASGINPQALDREQLIPRLAQAGAMGGLMSLAFQLPHQSADFIRRQQVAAHAALADADQLGAVIEAGKAVPVAERSSGRWQAMLEKIIPAEAATRYFQKEDFDEAAKAAGMSPDDLAAQMNVEEQYRLAQATGKTMEVPTAAVVNAGVGMEKPEAIKGLLMAQRKIPTGANGTEALQFFKDTPEAIARQVTEMEQSVKASAITEDDPVYRDIKGQMLDAGRPEQEADSIARLNAAVFNTLAKRLSTPEKAVTGQSLYEPYKLRIATEAMLPKPDAMDAALERLRRGDIPTEKQVRGESLLEFLRRRGINDEGGELAAMEADANRQPGQQSLINPEGRAYDHAAEAAYEAGFIPDQEVPTLMEAISNELAGRPVYAEAGGDAHLEPIRQGLLDLQAALKRHGIALEQSNADIKAALEKAEGVPIAEYQQRLEVPSAYLKHEYLLKQWKKAHGDRSPTPGDKEWQKLVEQADMVDEAQGRKFYQQDDTDARGSLSYNAQRHFLVTLTGKANLSTTLHESGHFWLEVMGDIAKREDAPEQLRQDYAKAREFIGAKEGEALTTAQHERFARAIEQYLMEGHAPSAELRPVFQRFFLWLTDLYRKFKSLVNLTPEVRQVFDRLLATDDAIKQAESDGAGSTIFPNREASGMNEREWGAYLRATQDARDSMRAKVFNAAMATLRRERTKTFRAEKAAATKEAEDLVAKRPVHIAESYLVHGVDKEGKDLPEKPKLDRDEIERDYGEGTIHLLPRGITAKGGWSLRFAAELFGFRSGRELWEALRNMPDRKAEVKALVEGMMKARHPEMTDEALLEKAHAAVHENDSVADVLERESTALAVKAGRRAVPQAILKETARRVIAETNYQDVRPDLYLAAERKNSRLATDLFAKGDFTGAFLAKQQEELSHHLVKEAQAAQKVIAKTDTMMRDATRDKTQAMLGKAGGQSWLVRDGKGQVIEGFYDEKQATGLAREVGGVVVSGPGFQETMNKLVGAWKDPQTRQEFTYGQVKDLHDAASETLHLAREQFTILQDGKRVQLANAIAAAVKTQADTGRSSIRPFNRGGLGYKIMRFARQLDAMNRTMAAVCKELDGGKEDGWHWRNLIRPGNEAANVEQAMRIEDFGKLRDLIDNTWGKRGQLNATVRIPAIGKELSLENRIAVGLNMGSTRNLERLMSNFGGDVGNVTKEQLEAITATLDEKDWALITGIWKLFDSKWAAIEAMQRKQTGIAPEKRDSIPVRTAFGTIDGSYYPIAYDPEAPGRSATLSLEEQQPSLWNTPRAGFAERTVRTTGMPIRLDFAPIFRHLNDVSHYLSHAEYIDSANKIVNNAQWKESTISRFGKETYDVVFNRIKTIAVGNQAPVTAVEQGLRWLRQRSGAAVMGFNVMSGLSHWLGLSQSMHEVGYGRYVAAAGKYFTNATTAESARAFIESRSLFMKNMGTTMAPEQLEALNQGPIAQVPQWFRDHAYSFMHFNLRHINSITWLARYETAMEENPADEGRAVALADQAVKNTQGSGLTIDLTRAQDASELTRLMMQYGAFFTRTYQMMRPSVVGARLSDPQSIMKLGLDFASLVILPTVIHQAFLQWVKPDPTNDGSAAWWAKRLGKDSAEYLLATFIFGREIASGIEGFDYRGPAGMRSIGLLGEVAKELFGDQHTTPGKAARTGMLLTGNLLGMPVNQLDHLIQGYLYDSEHGSANPAPLIFGPPRR